MLRPSPDALTVNMTRVHSHHSRLAPGGGGAPASPPFLWDVPRVAFSSCKGMNIPVFFCSSPLWVLAHHCRCPTFHSSADPSSQGARAVQDAVLPWLGYISWPGLCNSAACARQLTKVPPGNRLSPFVSGFPPGDSAQSQRLGGDRLPATASPCLSFSSPAKHPPLLSTTTPHRVRRDSCKLRLGRPPTTLVEGSACQLCPGKSPHHTIISQCISGSAQVSSPQTGSLGPRGASLHRPKSKDLCGKDGQMEVDRYDALQQDRAEGTLCDVLSQDTKSNSAASKAEALFPLGSASSELRASRQKPGS